MSRLVLALVAVLCLALASGHVVAESGCALNPELTYNITIYQGDYVDLVQVGDDAPVGHLGGGRHSYTWSQGSYITTVKVYVTWGFVNSLVFIDNNGVTQGALGSVTKWPGVVSNITTYTAPAGYGMVGANATASMNTDPYYGIVLVDGFVPTWAPAHISAAPVRHINIYQGDYVDLVQVGDEVPVGQLGGAFRPYSWNENSYITTVKVYVTYGFINSLVFTDNNGNTQGRLGSVNNWPGTVSTITTYTAPSGYGLIGSNATAKMNTDPYYGKVMLYSFEPIWGVMGDCTNTTAPEPSVIVSPPIFEAPVNATIPEPVIISAPANAPVNATIPETEEPINTPCILNPALVKNITIWQGDFIDVVQVGDEPAVGQDGGDFRFYTWNEDSHITQVQVLVSEGFVNSLFFTDNNGITQGMYGGMSMYSIITTYTAPAGYAMIGSYATARYTGRPGYHKYLVYSFEPIWGVICEGSAPTSKPSVIVTPPIFETPVNTTIPETYEPISAPTYEIEEPVNATIPVEAPVNATVPVNAPTSSSCNILNPALINHVTIYQGDYVDQVQVGDAAPVGHLGGGRNTYSWPNSYITTVKVYVTWGFVNSIVFIDNNGNTQGRLGSVTRWPGVVSNITTYTAPAGYGMVGANATASMNTDPYYGVVLVDDFVPTWAPAHISTSPIRHINIYQGDYVDLVQVGNEAPVGQLGGALYSYNWADSYITSVKVYVTYGFINSLVFTDNNGNTQGRLGSVNNWPGTVSTITTYTAPAGYAMIGSNAIAKMNTDPYYGKVMLYSFEPIWGVFCDSPFPEPPVIVFPPFFEAPVNATIPETYEPVNISAPIYAPVNATIPETEEPFNATIPVEAPVNISAPIYAPVNDTIPETYEPVNATVPVEAPVNISAPIYVETPVNTSCILNPALVRNITTWQGDYIDVIQVGDEPAVGQRGGDLLIYTWDEDSYIIQVTVYATRGFVNGIWFTDNNGTIRGAPGWWNTPPTITTYTAPAGYAMIGSRATARFNSDPYGKYLVNSFEPIWGVICDGSVIPSQPPIIPPIVSPFFEVPVNDTIPETIYEPVTISAPMYAPVNDTFPEPIAAPCTILNSALINNISVYQQGRYVEMIQVGDNAPVGQPGWGGLFSYTWNEDSYITQVEVQFIDGFISGLFFTDNNGTWQGHGVYPVWPNVSTYTTSGPYGMVGANVTVEYNAQYGKFLPASFQPIWGNICDGSAPTTTSEPSIIVFPPIFEAPINATIPEAFEPVNATIPETEEPVNVTIPSQPPIIPPIVEAPVTSTAPAVFEPANAPIYTSAPVEAPTIPCATGVRNPALISNVTIRQGDYVDQVQVGDAAPVGAPGGGPHFYSWGFSYITTVKVYVTWGFVNSIVFIDNNGNSHGRLGSVTNWPGVVSNITTYTAPAGYGMVGANATASMNTDPYYGIVLVDGFVPIWGPAYIAAAPVRHINIYQGDYVDLVQVGNEVPVGQLGGGLHTYTWNEDSYITTVKVYVTYGFINSLVFTDNNGNTQGRLGSVNNWPGTVSTITVYTAPSGYAMIGSVATAKMNTDPYYGKVMLYSFEPIWGPARACESPSTYIPPSTTSAPSEVILTPEIIPETSVPPRDSITVPNRSSLEPFAAASSIPASALLFVVAFAIALFL